VAGPEKGKRKMAGAEITSPGNMHATKEDVGSNVHHFHYIEAKHLKAGHTILHKGVGHRVKSVRHEGTMAHVDLEGGSLHSYNHADHVKVSGKDCPM
jgi:hypothetical protein